MKLFVLAGEPSGDRLGADLVGRLRARTEVELSGVGGPELIEQGLASMFPMHELSVMGWRDMLPRLPWLYFRAWQVARRIVRTRPDVALLIDAQMFSAVVARQVRRAAPDIALMLYVAPAVWAWAPERAARLKPVFDEILGVLPFEPRVMRELGGPPTHYVGHPALRRFPFREAVPDRGPLLLLPGSREGELRRHLPLMRALAEHFGAHRRVSGIIMPTLPFLEPRLKEETAHWGTPVEVVSGAERRTEAIGQAIAACTSMGTATLELALAGVPMVGLYVADKGQERRWFRYKVRFASLPNILLDDRLVPEALFREAQTDPVRLIGAVYAVLESAEGQLAGFRRMRAMMEEGLPPDGVADPVDRLLSRVARSARSPG